MSSIAYGLFLIWIGFMMGLVYRELALMAAVGFIALALFWPSPAKTECFPSLQAARAIHSTGHISWSGGCYFAGYPSHSHSKRHEAKSIPLPRERPAVFGPSRLVESEPPQLTREQAFAEGKKLLAEAMR